MNAGTDGQPVISEERPPIDIKELLFKKGYSSDEVGRLMKKDVLFLTYGSKTQFDKSGQELLTPEMVEVEKVLLNDAKQLQIDLSLDKNKQHRYLELLEAEVYIGLMVFFAVAAWDVAKGIISNWLYDHFRSMKKDGKTLRARIEIQITDTERGIIRHVEYSGPADKVGEIIKKAVFE